MDNPLYYDSEFMDVMKIKASPEAFVFDPRKASQYMQVVVTVKPSLLPKLESLLDGTRLVTQATDQPTQQYTLHWFHLYASKTCTCFSKLNGKTVLDYAI